MCPLRSFRRTDPQVFPCWWIWHERQASWFLASVLICLSGMHSHIYFGAGNWVPRPHHSGPALCHWVPSLDLFIFLSIFRVLCHLTGLKLISSLGWPWICNPPASASSVQQQTSVLDSPKSTSEWKLLKGVDGGVTQPPNPDTQLLGEDWGRTNPVGWERLGSWGMSWSLLAVWDCFRK